MLVLHWPDSARIVAWRTDRLCLGKLPVLLQICKIEICFSIGFPNWKCASFRPPQISGREMFPDKFGAGNRNVTATQSLASETTQIPVAAFRPVSDALPNRRTGSRITVPIQGNDANSPRRRYLPESLTKQGRDSNHRADAGSGPIPGKCSSQSPRTIPGDGGSFRSTNILHRPSDPKPPDWRQATEILSSDEPNGRKDSPSRWP